MRRLVLNRLRLQWARYVLIGLCVAVSAAFSTASFMLSTTMNASLVSSMAEGSRNADLVIATDNTYQGPDQQMNFATMDQVNEIAEVDGVEAVWPQPATYAAMEGQGSNDPGLYFTVAPTDTSLFPWDLAEGAFPTEEGEILLTQGRAESAGLAVGDSFTAQPAETYQEAPADGSTDAGQVIAPEPAELTVTGIVDVPEMSSFTTGWVTQSQFTAMSPQDSEIYVSSGDSLVRLAPGADLETVRSGIQDLLAADDITADVLTPQEQTDQLLEEMSGDSNIMLAFLLAFALLAAIVAFLVITTTFGVLTAQRARELALLRCLGATGAQLRRSVLLEALVIGVVASALGVAAIVGVGFALSPVLPDWVVVAVSARDVLAGLGLGVLVTLLASFGPARRAMQASPLDGMRGSRASDRIPVVRSVIGTIVFLGGAGTLAWAASVQDQAVVGIVSGAATGLGLVLTSRLWMPGVVYLLGKLLPGRTPSALAAANAARHPARTTTTATALLIGITLVATVLTGHAVAQRSVLEHLDERDPVDVTISQPVDDSAVGELEGVGNVLSVDRTDGETHIDLQQGIGGGATSDALSEIGAITGADSWETGRVALDKAMYVDILNIMLGVALGLLGASVLVSVLGIASTMSLSVLERTRENSLLRALGLSRGQLASTIRREALLVAAAACAAGVIGGWLLGTSVVSAMVTPAIPVLLTVPWVGFAAVVLGGWLTAMIAAALPTRRATRVSPVEGLASVE